MKKNLLVGFLSLFCFIGIINIAAANTVAVGDVYTQTAGVVTVPVSITGNTNVVTAVNISVTYDAALATLALTDIYTGIDLVNAGWTAVPSFSPPIPNSTVQTLQLVYYDPYSILPNAGTLPNIGLNAATLVISDLKFTLLSTAANVSIVTSTNSTVFSTGNVNISAQYTVKNGSINIGTTPVITKDTTPPVITITGANPMTVAQGSTFNDPGTTVTDNVSTGLTATATGTVNTQTVGTYTLTYAVSDAAGNAATPVTRTVNVTDQTAPAIALTGASPMTVAQGSVFTDPGTTVTDNVSTGLTATATGIVNTQAVGTYTLTYAVSDAAGNVATPVTRTVNVTDQTAPVITLTGANPITVAQGSVFTDPGSTVTDNVSMGLTAMATGAVKTQTVGTYTLTYAVSDAAGNAATAITRIVNVTDQTVPVITLTGASIMTIALGGTFTDAGSTVTDNVSTGLTATATGTVKTQVVGIYTLTYAVSDAAGNAATPVTRTVNVTDQIAPVITLTGASPITVAQGSTFADPGTTVTDNVNTGLTATATGTVNTQTVGTYTLTYAVNDVAGNAATPVTRTVNVTDQTAPMITLTGKTPVTIAQGSTFADPGTTVTDNVDTGLTTTATGTVNTQAVGTYTLTYAVSDAAGNTATPMTRTVNVTDQTVPVITLTGTTSMTVAQGSTFTDPGSTVTDNVSTGLTATVTGTVNTQAVGTYTLIYAVNDTAGNAATSVTRTVNVTDQTAPVITLTGTSPITVAQGSTFADPGTTVTDNVDTGLTTTATGSVNTQTVGAYTLTYAVSDAAGNAATPITRTVNVTDQTAPVITLIGANAIPVVKGATFTDPGATVQDNVDTGLTATVTGTVNTQAVGIYILTYAVSDAAGNAATAITRTVNVSLDAIAPTVTAPASITLAAFSPTGTSNTNATIATFLTTATAMDNIAVVGTVTNDAPATTFPVGVTTVTFSAKDAAGNIGKATANVTISAYIDAVAPVVTAPASIDIYSLNLNGLTLPDAAIATFLAKATATDNVGVVGGVSNNAATTFPVGMTTVTFTATDAAGNKGTATANVTVIGNHSPVANPNSAVTIADSYTQIKQVLANDTDLDGNTLMVTAVDMYSAANGTIVDRYTGNFTYTPPAGFTGMDKFNYTISDGVGGTAIGVVRISVKPNLAPALIGGQKPPVLLSNGNNGVIMAVNTSKVLKSFAVNDIYTNADAYTYTATVTLPATAYNAINSATFGVPTASRLTIVAGATAGVDVVTIMITDPITTLTSFMQLKVTIQDPYAGGNTAAPAGDGMTVAQKNANNLDPYATDSDGDGVSDTVELGDPNNPTDVDGDGVIDALEPAGNSDDPSKAFGMRDSSGTSVGIDSYGNTLASVALSPAPTSLTKPTGISLEMIAYEATLPSNATSITSRFVFSAALPTPLKLFKVDSAGVYTEIPALNTTIAGEGWTQIDANTVALTLKDGGAFDQDGKVNGIVVDPVAIAQGAVAATTPAATGGGGGCTIANDTTAFDPIFLFMLLFAFVYGLRRTFNI